MLERTSKISFRQNNANKTELAERKKITTDLHNNRTIDLTGNEEFPINAESNTILYEFLDEIEGLTDDEQADALIKFPNHPRQMLIFLGLPPSMGLA
ncbi:hypothetical protein Gotur_026433 [Gossypium turneri]